MSERTTYVSFAYGERYCAALRRLEESAKTFGVNLVPYVMPTANGPGWKQIVNLKPGYLAAQRRILRGPICWIDADAEFCSDPKLEEVCAGFDVGLVRHSDSQINGAFVWLADTAPALAFAEAWAEAVRARPKSLDQEHLAGVVSKVYGLRVCWLPRGYSWVETEPVYIRQHQASRALSEAEKK